MSRTVPALVLLAAVLGVGLSGCAGEQSTASGGNTITPVSTEKPVEGTSSDENVPDEKTTEADEGEDEGSKGTGGAGPGDTSTSTSGPSGGVCPPERVGLMIGPVEGAAGSRGTVLRITNMGEKSCRVPMIHKLQFQRGGTALPTKYQDQSDPDEWEALPPLRPGQSAEVQLVWPAMAGDGSSDCGTTPETLGVVLKPGAEPKDVAWPYGAACDGGRITVVRYQVD